MDSQELAVVNNDHTNGEGKNMPPSGFTQRATIDCERDEIYVLSVSNIVIRNLNINLKFRPIEPQQGERTKRPESELFLDVLIEDGQMDLCVPMRSLCHQPIVLEQRRL